MVRIKGQLPLHPDGSLDQNAWLKQHFSAYPDEQQSEIISALQYAKLVDPQAATDYGQPCFEQGLECAEILSRQHASIASICTSIVYCTLQQEKFELDDIKEHLGQEICQLIEGLMNIAIITQLQQQTARTSGQQIDNLRKMMLAMVSDVRVVLISLAQRVCIMRGIQVFGEKTRHGYAQETMDVFAPLANRLGISNIKWELEDLSFHDLQAETYLSIAKSLAEKRIDREQRIADVITLLTKKLKAQHITAEIAGRAKHIYSIHKKMLRKEVPFDEVYDIHAVRIIVDNKDQCYAALGLVHELWTAIPEEFDDYISTPKPNGYQSIHTAVYGPGDKYLEVQIRTHKMHEENELGGAAHWLYKEGSQAADGYEAKISWLRELLDWHRGLSHNDDELDQLHDHVFEDRVYVFTPSGDIIDLPTGSTPLDFAYHIHSEVGHRCKGAKVNDKMVPLTHTLQTGDRITIVKNNAAKPSRDWLSTDSGYLTTSRARAKVHQWFRKQDLDKNIADGRSLLDKELQRLHLNDVKLDKIANELHTKSVDHLCVNIVCGNIKLGQVIQTIKNLYPQTKVAEDTPSKSLSKPKFIPKRKGSDINVHGISNLLNNIAQCCKPIPGDPIIGYITRGKGVSIHHQDCPNILNLSTIGQSRLIEAEWNELVSQSYVADLVIHTQDGADCSTKISSMLTHDKINVLNFNDKNVTTNNQLTLRIQIADTENLATLMNKLNQLPEVMRIERS